MKFQILSDVHIERYNHDPTLAIPFTNVEYFLQPSAPVLILAGDIGSIYKFEQLKAFISDCCSKFEHVLYVPGNHEFYFPNPKVVKGAFKLETLKDLELKLISLEKLFSNLTVLIRKIIKIQDTYIYGGILWSIPEKNLKDASALYKKIIEMNSQKEFQKFYDFEKQCLESSLNIIHELDSFAKVMVITHYAPSVQSIKDVNAEYKSLEYTDLDHLLSDKTVNMWIHGHTHHNVDYVHKNGTRVITNQLGKPNYFKDKIAKQTFLKNTIIEI